MIPLCTVSEAFGCTVGYNVHMHKIVSNTYANDHKCIQQFDLTMWDDATLLFLYLVSCILDLGSWIDLTNRWAALLMLWRT